MNQPPSTTRRGFLARSLTAGTALALPTTLRSGSPPSERIHVGCIGMGGHGVARNLRLLLQQADARVVAVCDVFRDRRDGSRRQVNRKLGTSECAAYTDFRRILDRKDIDAVMISTPDHWHALMSVLAIRSGKDVICEKPTLTVEEGRILSDTVTKHKAVFQMSTEDRSLPCYHFMAEAIRNGVVGDVRRVEVRLPAGQRFPNEQPTAVPSGLDYDLWLGPAPEASYTANRTERQHWRHVWDYSGGKFSDWGMHQLDTVQWALDTERTGPVKVRGKGSVNAGSMYNTFIDYDVTWTCADGIEVHVQSGGTSLRFEGTKGWLGNPRFAAAPEASDPDFLGWRPADGAVRLRTNPAGEHRDFLDCVKSRGEPYFPAEIGHRCATLLHIGNIAMRLDRELRWDSAAEQFIDDAEANTYLSRPMRAPWILEA